MNITSIPSPSFAENICSNIAQQDSESFLSSNYFSCIEKGQKTLTNLSKNKSKRELSELLINCCKDGSTQKVQALINSKKFNEPSRITLDFALFKASKCGHLDIVDALINSRSFNEIKMDSDVGLESALLISSKKGHLDIVNALINSRRSEEFNESILEIALHQASRDGHLNIVNALTNFRKSRV